MSILDRLKEPFPADEIEWRVGATNKDKTKGIALAYITARHVMERLDDVVGPECWQDRYEIHGEKTVCYLSLDFGDGWITKADGAGDTQIEAEKGGLSDAFKRAAVKWGIGRYLYHLDSPWVMLDGSGKRIHKDEYPKLRALLDGKAPVQTRSSSSVKKAKEGQADERSDWDRFMDALADKEDLESVQRFRKACEDTAFKVWPQSMADEGRAQIAEVEAFFQKAKEAFS